MIDKIPDGHPDGHERNGRDFGLERVNSFFIRPVEVWKDMMDEVLLS